MTIVKFLWKLAHEPCTKITTKVDAIGRRYSIGGTGPRWDALDATIDRCSQETVQRTRGGGQGDLVCEGV